MYAYHRGHCRCSVCYMHETLKQTDCFTAYTFGILKTMRIDLPQKKMETVSNKQSAADEMEKELILLTLNNYLEGRPIIDIGRVREAFHPDAHIRTIIDGKLVQWTVPQYLDLVAQATVQPCEPKLLSYSFDGDTGAAHVQLSFATFRFIDRFNLVKLDGKWLIVDKVSYRQELL